MIDTSTKLTSTANPSEDDLSEEAKEKLREEGKWKNYVPVDQKRPPDEFFDLKSI